MSLFRQTLENFAADLALLAVFGLLARWRRTFPDWPFQRDFAYFGPFAADLALLAVSGVLARCREPVQNCLFNRISANFG